jgi:hypothetical protein
MSQATLSAPQKLALTPALAELVNRNRDERLSPSALRALLRSVETLREKEDGQGRKQLLRSLTELFAWLPVGSVVVVNSSDGSWIVGPDESAVIDKFVALFGKDAPGRMFTVGRPAHVGGGLCSI